MVTFESFSLLCLPRAHSDFTQREVHTVKLDEMRREREGKKARGEKGGTKSGGRQALGGGRAKSQEHYIIAGGESEREGYESVD